MPTDPSTDRRQADDGPRAAAGSDQSSKPTDGVETDFERPQSGASGMETSASVSLTGATWSPLEATIPETGRSLTLARVEDAGDGPTPVVPLSPRLEREAGERPRLALSILLSRRPRPTEESFRHLITGGLVSVDVSLAVPPSVLASLGDGYRQLSARAVSYELRDGETVVAAADAGGSVTPTPLGASLDADGCKGVLDALVGRPTALSVRSTLSVAGEPIQSRVRLSGSAPAVHEYLSDRAPYGTLDEPTLRRHVASMVEEGELALDAQGTAADAVPEERIFELFLAAAMPIISEEYDGGYRLRPRPSWAFSLDVTETMSVPVLRTLELSVPLSDVLGGALAAYDWNDYVTLFPLEGDRIEPVPLRTRESRSRGPNDRLDFVRVGGQVATPLAHIDPAGETIRPDEGRWLAVDGAANRDDRQQFLPAVVAAFERPRPPRPTPTPTIPEPIPIVSHYPLVEDPSASVFPDRYRSRRWWYAPSYEPVPASVDDDPETAPFRFDVTVYGPDETLTRGMEARLTMRLHREPPDTDAYRRIEAADVDLDPVPEQNLTATLEVPYFDRDRRTDAVSSFPAAVERDGDDLVVMVDLIEEWVSLAYGALSTPGFQSRPVEVTVDYDFRAYRPAPKHFLQFVHGKTVATPVRYEEHPVDPEPVYVDATTATVNLPNRSIALRTEPPTTAKRSRNWDGVPLTASSRAGSRDGVVAAKPIREGVARPVDEILEAKPIDAVGSRPIVEPIVRPQPTGPDLAVERYVVGSVAHRSSSTVLNPCESVGHLYRRTVGGETEAIWCEDALRLREISFEPWNDVSTVLDTESRRYVQTVLQSRQQPGRYLVVPRTYRIGRREVPETETLRSEALVYSVAERESTAVSYTFVVTLRPHVPEHVRRDLLDRLESRSSAEPVLAFPTEAADAVETDWWTTSTTEGEWAPITRRGTNALTVMLSASDVTGQVFLDHVRQAGLQGTATFELPDGNEHVVDLDAHLGRLTGPQTGTPVAIVETTTGLTLVNRTENDVDVPELRLYPADGAPHSVAVNETLAAGDSTAIPRPTPDGERVPVVVQRSFDAAPVEELRTYVEHLTANLVFIDLVNHENHRMADLRVEARLSPDDPVRTVSMSGNPAVGEVGFSMPLTSVVGADPVEFRATAMYDVDHPEEQTPWLQWDLAERGPVVPITWELLTGAGVGGAGPEDRRARSGGGDRGRREVDVD